MVRGRPRPRRWNHGRLGRRPGCLHFVGFVCVFAHESVSISISISISVLIYTCIHMYIHMSYTCSFQRNAPGGTGL